MSARDLFERVWQGRAWVLAWWALSLMIAIQGGMTVAAAAAAAMRGYVGAADGHLLAAIFELVLIEEPAVAAAIANAVRASLVLGAVIWLVGTPIVYAVMAGQRTVGAVAARTWSSFVPILVQTVYVGVLRAGVILLGALVYKATGRLSLALLAVAPLWLALVVVLDKSRALAAERSVTDRFANLRRLHPGVLLEAATDIAAHKLRSVAACGLWLVALAWVPLAIYVAVHSAGSPAAVWGLRIGALLPLVLGFARIGLVSAPSAGSAAPEPIESRR